MRLRSHEQGSTSPTLYTSPVTVTTPTRNMSAAHTLEISLQIIKINL
jgi:hypothetical protein